MKNKIIGLTLAAASLLTGCKQGVSQSKAQSSESIASSTSSSIMEDKYTPSSFDIDEADDRITLTMEYADYFRIKEEYRFTDNVMSGHRTYIVFGSYNSLLMVNDYLQGALNMDACEEVSEGKYLYDTSECFYLVDAEGKSRAEVLKELRELTSKQPAVSVPKGTWDIRAFSKSTLLLEKSTMRVNVGETRQIVIAECPEGYAEELIFVSSNPTFASVDQYGNITGHCNGAVTVNVSIHGAAVYQTIMVYIV